MSVYYPDRYELLRITKDGEVSYKVFGTWVGGYLSGDSWRLNSGIQRVEEDGDMVKFIGYSGSIYKAYKEAVGTTFYTAGVLQQMLDVSSEDCKIEMITLQDYYNDQAHQQGT